MATRKKLTVSEAAKIEAWKRTNLISNGTLSVALGVHETTLGRYLSRKAGVQALVKAKMMELVEKKA